MAREPFMETRELVFAYRPDTIVIDQVNLSLYRGETAVLTGDNGAGKTTLGKLLAGILKPTEGHCLLDREDLHTIPLSRIGQKVGYCFQNPGKQLFAATVEAEVGFGLKYRGASPEHIENVTESLLQLFEIQHLRLVFPHNLSWGEKRRTALAACLPLEPKFLILDEPAAGLDEDRLKVLTRVLQSLREKGMGMLLISHNQRFIAANAQRILLMQEGRICDDRRC